MRKLSMFVICIASIFGLRMYAATEVNTMSELDQAIKGSKKPTYVDCYSKRCPPCRTLAPLFEKYSEKYASKGTFLKLSLDTNYEAVHEYDIQAMPTLLIFDKNGQLKDKIVGLGPISEFLETL